MRSVRHGVRRQRLFNFLIGLVVRTIRLAICTLLVSIALCLFIFLARRFRLRFRLQRLLRLF